MVNRSLTPNILFRGFTRDDAKAVILIALSGVLAYFCGPAMYVLFFAGSGINTPLLLESIGLVGFRGALMPYVVIVSMVLALFGGRRKYWWIAIAVFPAICARVAYENWPLTEGRFTDVKGAVELAALWAMAAMIFVGVGSLVRKLCRGALKLLRGRHQG